MNGNSNFKTQRPKWGDTPSWYRDARGVFNVGNPYQGFYHPTGNFENTNQNFNPEQDDMSPDVDWSQLLLGPIGAMAPQLLIGGLLGHYLFK